MRCREKLKTREQAGGSTAHPCGLAATVSSPGRLASSEILQIVGISIDGVLYSTLSIFRLNQFCPSFSCSGKGIDVGGDGRRRRRRRRRRQRAKVPQRALVQ